jgi:hypothetical protein
MCVGGSYTHQPDGSYVCKKIEEEQIFFWNSFEYSANIWFSVILGSIFCNVLQELIPNAMMV